MVYQIKILFMKADNSFIAWPKRGEKCRIGFKASLFCVKLTICKHMRKFCQLYLFREKVIIFSVYLLQLMKYGILMATL